jgi:hypothetical protein
MATLPLENRLLALTEELRMYTASGNIQVDYISARPQQLVTDFVQANVALLIPEYLKSQMSQISPTGPHK